MTIARPHRPWHLSPPSARDYFDLLGDGLVVVEPPRRPGGSESDEWKPPTGGAWVHLGTDGTVRAFTGKVEVGQGTRNALRLVVADELDLPVEKVELLLGDTDLCPWDLGTFGSRSMPDAAPALRSAAAAARDVLVERAAKLRGLPTEALSYSGGAVNLPGRAAPLPFAELVRGWRELRVVESGVDRGPPRWSRSGVPFVDPGATDVVTGSRPYVSDLRVPGLAYGAVLHPPKYGAALLRLDASRLGAGPGLELVREGEFVGVVAPTPWEARAALERLDAAWGDAEQPAEAEIEAYLRSHPVTEDAWDTDEFVVGDVRRGIAGAAASLAGTYRAAYVAHVPLEPRAALARWDGGRLTVWVGSQTPFRVAEQLARALGRPPEDVRVIVPYTGAAFGGKHAGDVALAAARLARHCGQPVQLAYTREEEFRFGYFRPLAIVDLQAGADHEGRLTSWTFQNVNAGSAALRTPYHVPNQEVRNVLARSPLPQGSYRALGATANNFARESAMDELASRLGIDPVAFRERNLDDERLLFVLRRSAERAGWSSWTAGNGRGHGVALGREKGSRISTVAEVSVSADRLVKVDRLLSVFDAGAVVHPDNLAAQVEGAAVMALGGALFEAVHFGEGRVSNPALSRYRVPRFFDVPDVEVELVDRREFPSAGGGETPMIAVAPAIANAIADACGLRLRSLPLLEDGRLPSTVPATASAARS